YAGHAAMIDGAFAKQTGAAFDGMPDYARERSRWAGGSVIGSAEYGYGGNAELGRDVHGAGIVGQEEIAGGGQGDEPGQRGFAGEVVRVYLTRGYCRTHLFADCALGCRTEDGHVTAGGAGYRCSRLGESFGQPPFGPSIRRSGTD